MPTTTYSEEEYKSKSVFADFQSSMLTSIFRREESKQRDSRERDSHKNDYWYYVPNHMEASVYKDLNKITGGTWATGNFLELGSGLGYYCHMARKFGYKAVGIEIDQDLIDRGNNVFGRNTDYTSFIQGDAMKQKSRISKADVIYFYSPFRGGKYGSTKPSKAKKFLRLVVDNAKKGAHLIMATHCPSESDEIRKLEKAKVIKKFGSLTWIKLKTPRVTAVKRGGE